MRTLDEQFHDYVLVLVLDVPLAADPGGFTSGRVVSAMTGSYGPPESFGFNKLRKSSGSHRLTLVKEAVRAAEIDPRPPRPVLALLPVSDGAWVGCDVDRHASQRARVDVRHALTAELAPETDVVGEYPVTVRGKLGSALLILPKQLVDTLYLESQERVTTVPVVAGCLLFATESLAADPETDLGAALDAARACFSDGCPEQPGR